jgi:hypothetical protein
MDTLGIEPYLPPPNVTPSGSAPDRPRNRRLVYALAAGAVALAAGGYLVGKTTRGSAGPNATASQASSADLAAAVSGRGPCTGPQRGVAGTLKSINGTSLTVTSAQGKDVTVTTSASTTVHKTVSGTAADITDGTVVAVHGTANGSNAIAADQVAILPAGAAPKLRQRPAGRLPGRAPGPGLAFGTAQKAGNGNFTVTEPDGTQITVSTSTSTKVVKTVDAALKDLEIGKPIAVDGTVNSDGSVAATQVAQGTGDLGVGGQRGFGRFGGGGPGRGFVPPPYNAPIS